ncbi:ABC-2 family transporter protein [Pseudomonas sp. G(2018)]|uniref:ABC-2 family transporter protein n=1 Tax=Pseudomonas sp. G(2018) TaxID=2502242 RepID=UPI0010F8B08D|nr:ABC-2 family transporter protein [Pseudomonas sp. G(2018)]
MLITDLLIATGVPFLIQFAIWRFVYEGAATDMVSQYSLEETYLYYVAVLALNRLNNAYDLIVRVSTHVHEGQLEGILIKPISYFKYNFFLFVGGSILYYIPVVMIAFFVTAWRGEWIGVLGFVSLSIVNLGFCFLLGFFMSLFTFWLTRPDMILSLQVVLASVIGGTLLPIAYWPAYLEPLMRYNPFRLIISGPAEFLLRPSSGLLLELLCLYIVWFLILLAACKTIFGFASNRYAGAGG